MQPIPSDGDAEPDWFGGWLRTAQHRPSTHHGPRPLGTAIDLIVVHSISLPPGVFGGPAVEQLFLGQLDWDSHPYYQLIRGIEVSAHFFIRRHGEVVQFVDTQARAWHAGASCWQGRANCNDFSIGIELEGLEGGLFEDAQYASLTTLCQQLRQRHPIAHVVGHEHIAPGRKQDPGPGFDWPRLARALGWETASVPACA